MQTLFKGYHKTAELQKQIEIERDRVQKENKERLERIQAVQKELEAMQRKLEDPANTEVRKQSIMNDLRQKANEGSALDSERREFMARREKLMNETMVKHMKDVIQEISDRVNEQAKAAGYQLVFDQSGLSSSQVPFLIYSEIDDLTDPILEELNKDAPDEE